mgnify:CR=1 FL=1
MTISTRALTTPGDEVRRMTLSNTASPFGCCNFFDQCADSIMSLYYRPGTLGLLDWLGWNVTTDCYRVVDFISYLRPAPLLSGYSPGYIANPCSDPYGIEFGSCSLSVDDFGRFGRSGPTRDLWKPQRYCKTNPRKFYDGSPVEDERTWDLFFTMDQVLNDIRIALITGNDSVGGQFNGLQRWVRTGYTCSALDSYVLDWNGNNLDGTGGGAITLNGNPVASGFTLVDWLLDLTRNIRQRIAWSPLLNNQQMKTGDVIILLPSFAARGLLDEFACWSVCPGAQYEEVQKNLADIREFRQSLNGGLFGDGQISLDGYTIPLLAYDWGLINGPTTCDMYVLTGAVGNQRIWEGEFLDANQVLASLGDLADNLAYMPMDGGRFLMALSVENLCSAVKIWMRNRLWCLAPWAQVRIQDVVVRTPSGPLSPDPLETSFYPQTSFTPAECP